MERGLVSLILLIIGMERKGRELDKSKAQLNSTQAIYLQTTPG
jgi:hypothetical protein